MIRTTVNLFMLQFKKHLKLVHAINSTLLFHPDDASETFTSKHVLKGLVDFGEWDCMGNEFFHFKLLQQHSFDMNQSIK